jgi:uncharacterized protein YaiI (UPF0178 family)
MIIQQKKKKVKEKIGRAYKEQNYSNIFLGKNRHRHHRSSSSSSSSPRKRGRGRDLEKFGGPNEKGNEEIFVEGS